MARITPKITSSAAYPKRNRAPGLLLAAVRVWPTSALARRLAPPTERGPGRRGRSHAPGWIRTSDRRIRSSAGRCPAGRAAPDRADHFQGVRLSSVESGTNFGTKFDWRPESELGNGDLTLSSREPSLGPSGGRGRALRRRCRCQPARSRDKPASADPLLHRPTSWHCDPLSTTCSLMRSSRDHQRLARPELGPGLRYAESRNASPAFRCSPQRRRFVAAE
jgi:hypothetical protein